MENFPHGPQDSVLRGKYCYIEFHPKHSLVFFNVLRSHVTLSHPFHPTFPFKILASSCFHNFSTAFLHLHHIHHINHRYNMPVLSQNPLGIFWAVTECHWKHYGHNILPSQSYINIKEISVLYFLFQTLLLLHSCPFSCSIKGPIPCSYSPVCNQPRSL